MFFNMKTRRQYAAGSFCLYQVSASLVPQSSITQRVRFPALPARIDGKKVKETVGFLLYREEAHNAMFREAFNKVQSSGSNRDIGATKAAKMYFSLSEPSPEDSRFSDISGKAPAFS